jgi:hypothetical protein
VGHDRIAAATDGDVQGRPWLSRICHTGDEAGLLDESFRVVDGLDS